MASVNASVETYLASWRLNRLLLSIAQSFECRCMAGVFFDLLYLTDDPVLNECVSGVVSPSQGIQIMQLFVG
ncbi:hypothetical protein N7522_008049 [Penicillium canescens]|nr:hypothetical protein N7522_008049 [Penicillium canescens]